MVQTTSEFCDGTCNDADLYHEALGSCSEYCFTTRFENRCHCGRKYVPRPKSPELKARADEFLATAIGARLELAKKVGSQYENIMVMITRVPADLWDALDVQGADSTYMNTKKWKGSPNDMGIAFWRAPERESKADVDG